MSFNYFLIGVADIQLMILFCEEYKVVGLTPAKPIENL